MDGTAYELGRLTGFITIPLLLGGLVWLVVHLARRGSSRTRGPDMAADLAALGRVLTVHTAPDHAALLVGQVLGAGPFAPAGAAGHWQVAGQHVLVRLRPHAHGSVLEVHELMVPLTSPQSADAWRWATDHVEQGAAQVGVATSRSDQHFVARQVDAVRALWSAA